MELTFMPRGILQINDAHITYKNFSGIGTPFNREGDRNFSLIIPDQETADALINDKNEYGVGWNVKIKEPKEEGDDYFRHLKVKVKFTDYGPNVYLVTGKNRVRLSEETIHRLDKIYIDHVDLDIRPYDAIVQGRPFRSAYLQSIQVVQDLSRDRFASEYDEDPEDLPSY